MSGEDKEKLNMIAKIVLAACSLFISVVISVIGFFAKQAYQTINMNQEKALAEIAFIKNTLSEGSVVRENHEQRIRTVESEIAKVQATMDDNSKTIDYLSAMLDLRDTKKSK